MRNRADLLFNNLQGDKDYQLVVEAYKLGQLFASCSLTLGNFYVVDGGNNRIRLLR